MDRTGGEVAVITGGASGIGLALARRLAGEGARLALADVEQETLSAAAAELEAAGAEVLAARVDVSRGEEVEGLAEQVYARWGATHLLFNNAGVGVPGPSWELSLGDWEWILGVNLWGVVHGIRAFVPRMIAQGQPGHVVNTASLAGLIAPPYLAPYVASKHAVVGISESLSAELQLAEAPVGVTVLCPGYVNTRIYEAERNRPAHLPAGPTTQDLAESREFFSQAMDPDQVAAEVLQAARAGRFLVTTHPGTDKALRRRVDDLLAGRPPNPDLDEARRVQLEGE